jgi:hypothetical protein
VYWNVASAELTAACAGLRALPELSVAGTAVVEACQPICAIALADNRSVKHVKSRIALPVVQLFNAIAHLS